MSRLEVLPALSGWGQRYCSIPTLPRMAPDRGRPGPRVPGAEVVYRDADGVFLLRLLDSRVTERVATLLQVPSGTLLTNTPSLQDQSLVAHALAQFVLVHLYSTLFHKDPRETFRNGIQPNRKIGVVYKNREPGGVHTLPSALWFQLLFSQGPGLGRRALPPAKSQHS